MLFCYIVKDKGKLSLIIYFLKFWECFNKERKFVRNYYMRCSNLTFVTFLEFENRELFFYFKFCFYLFYVFV